MFAGAVAATVALIGSLVLAAPVAAVSTVAPAAVDTGIVQTAAVAGFNPENIISDALFYDGNAMSSAEIQAFLDAKIGSCTNGKCLNMLNVSISSRDSWYSAVTGDLVCSALQGGTMRVSELIYRVQVACGISAKAILVTLQKEQGLTTSSAPSDWNLQAAMGASCPDTAPCDPAYSGVGPQIVQGVRQLKIYKAGRFAKQPGVNFIGYSPDSSCGGTNLNIQNYATAALYNYTPYQPNAASLAAGWGLGDGCSSYGNRNFYNYYTSWFGATQRDPAAEIEREYQAQGGGATLGAPVTGILTLTKNGGGYARAYANGSIYWTLSTGARTVWVGPIRDYYFARGGADGALGWPAAARENVTAPTGNGAAQLFTGASVFASARGTFQLTDPIRAAYFTAGSVFGGSGWPDSEVNCASGVCSQNFEGSLFVTSPAGVYGVPEPIRTGYLAAGGLAGSWGLPISQATAIAGTSGSGQAFGKGSAYALSGSPAVWVTGPIRDFYFSRGGAVGELGYPTEAATCADASSCRQAFEHGTVLWGGADGARIIEPAIEDVYTASGGASGPLGERTSGLLRYSFNGGGTAQAYARGAIYFTPSVGAHAVSGTIRDAYNATGGAAGRFGWPSGDRTCSGDVCEQAFQGGVMVVTGRGVFTVAGGYREGFVADGGSAGTWGPPQTDVISLRGGSGQVFGSGSAFQRGDSAAVFVSGRIRDEYFSRGGATGSFGFPLDVQKCASDADCRQQFENGWIILRGGQLQFQVPAIDTVYSQAGGAAGVLGARPGTVLYYAYNGGGFAEAFGQGSVFFKPSVGAAFAVTGRIRDTYFAAGGAAGSFGWPTGEMKCQNTTCVQSFEGGSISTGP